MTSARVLLHYVPKVILESLLAYTSMKQTLIRYLLKVLSLFHPKIEDVNSFLVVSTTGLGDSLWGTPAIRTLRQAHPKAYIGLLTSPLGKEVFENNPSVSEIFVLKKPLLPSLFRLYFVLRKKKIHTALIFHVSQRVVIPLCKAIGAQKIAGTSGINKECDDLLTLKLPNKREHEIERRLAIIASCGKIEPLPSMEIFPGSAAKKEADAFIQKHAIEPFLPIVIIHPGSKDQFKQWPPECFITLGKRLIQHLGCALVISGNREETSLVQEISTKIPSSIPLQGELRIHAFAELIKKCSLFITNDTGPMHVAFAMQAPTVALFGPTDPKLCGPYLVEKTALLIKQPTCAPCLKKKCFKPFCLLQISPDEVFNAAVNLFYQGKQL